MKINTKIRCFFYPQITQIPQMKIKKKSANFFIHRLHRFHR